MLRIHTAYSHLHADPSLTELEVLTQTGLAAQVHVNGACIDLMRIERDCKCPVLFVGERTYLVLVQSFEV